MLCLSGSYFSKILFKKLYKTIFLMFVQNSFSDIRHNVKLIEKAVISKEPRFTLRVLRTLVTLRKNLNSNVLRKAFAAHLPASSSKVLLEYMDELMDTEEVVRAKNNKCAPVNVLVETDVFFHLLLLVHLIDSGKLTALIKCAEDLMCKLKRQNRRSLDPIASRCYFYYSRAYELNNKLDEVRDVLNARLCTSTLKSDIHSQATLFNLLLRNYLHFNLYDQAAKLIAKSTFPENASNNEWARYLYYHGRVKAIQLDYSSAHSDLVEALRKAPQHTAVGFKQTVQKFVITVELLLGEIPEKATFRLPHFRKTLQAYLQLTQAVRTGNLSSFSQVLEDNQQKFELDGTSSLIVRLRHNVIKTGVRIISQSYSRISLSDVAKKLQLGSPEDAEFIVAKAIRDGVIEALIDHEHKYMQSKENPDIYSTNEPMSAFHQRINFCLNIHNQSIKVRFFKIWW